MTLGLLQLLMYKLSSDSKGRLENVRGLSSLVASSDGGRVWREVPGPTDDRLYSAQFLDLIATPQGGLDLLTTIGHYRRAADGVWSPVGVPVAVTKAWRKWVHDLHTGHVFGQMGRRTAEFGAWGLILLTVSGLVLHRRGGRKRPQ